MYKQNLNKIVRAVSEILKNCKDGTLFYLQKGKRNQVELKNLQVFENCVHTILI